LKAARELSTNEKKRIVILGGVAAGTSAASKAKRIDPNADVKIIQEESVVSYRAFGIPYVIEGVINNFEKQVMQEIYKVEKKLYLIMIFW
jgi:NADPH-dependent 2,4-dienoyl-CoA reductase/sulfur reductase-like enzyme